METLKRWFKQWIWNLKWVQYEVKEAIKREEVNYATRLFKHATEDVKEGYQEDIEERAKELMMQRLNEMLSTVDMNLIVTKDSRHGLIYIGGEPVPEGRIADLCSEAQFLKESEIWRLINETIKELAQRDLFTNGDTLDNIRKGRSILYTLSAQNNILKIFLESNKKTDIPNTVHTFHR